MGVLAFTGVAPFARARAFARGAVACTVAAGCIIGIVRGGSTTVAVVDNLATGGCGAPSSDICLKISSGSAALWRSTSMAAVFW